MNLNDRANSLYGLKQWGKGYFSVNENGELCVLPERLEKSRISLPDVINEVKTQGIELPVVVRFHDILRSEVKNLNTTFNQIIKESGYTGNFFGVYPIKVNQMREVVEEIVDAGAEYKYGLEAGSKAELLSVLALNTTADTLTIANGYKDNDYMKLVLLGRKLGRKVIVVIEKFSDLKKIVELSKEMNIEPMIGLRTKISTKGGGKWSESGGEKAKFGLTHVELLKAVHYLDSQGMRHTIKLLHYHIGSQVPNIQTIKDAVIEATRIYGELHRIGVSIDYLDVGGGLGIDYDGSKSTHFSSINYTNEMYISNIIYGIKDICEEMEVPEPDIVTESGRAISAHHSCIITEAIDKIDHTKHDMPLDP
ncbi:MAG: biosynthetic arginine decarboxylase, partial [Halobacteriovoraceae bacterium]|nr:biosynthetic arginine decarboxylase [Halobacteriovoraceae bacterium]